MKSEYRLVDVFTDRPFGGNQLAVFPDGRGIDDATMQRIAGELHLAETTFVLPPESGGDHRVRIFTPARELPFAGHPTIGTAWVLAGGRDASLVLELGVGPIRVTVREGFVEMEQPLPSFGDVLDDRAAMARALSLEPADVVAESPMQSVSSGLPFRFVRLSGLDAMRRVSPVPGPLTGEQIYVFTTETVEPSSTVHGRMFAPGLGIAEDAATGSAHGPLGAYLVRHGIVPAADAVRIRSEQGFEMGRPSILQVRVGMRGAEVHSLHVGGGVVPMGGGWFDL